MACCAAEPEAACNGPVANMQPSGQIHAARECPAVRRGAAIQHRRATVKFRFLPKDEDFYDLFVEVSERTAESAKLLRALLTGQPDRVTYHVDAIRKLEHVITSYSIHYTKLYD